MKIFEKQKIEIEYWKNSLTEKPESNSIDNIINKMMEAAVFIDCLHKFQNIFNRSKYILELGGGQGWASCIVKKKYPKSFVMLSDISEFAIASVNKWESIFKVKIDERFSCKSYKIPKNDSSCDCIFAFSAAHHFLAHNRTLSEIKRVLKPQGHCLYFYEPSCRHLLYKIAFNRVNKKRHLVPEDVLIYNKIQKLAYEVGLKCFINFYPSLIHRSPLSTIYYSILNKFSLLQKFFPCTINYHFIN